MLFLRIDDTHITLLSYDQDSPFATEGREVDIPFAHKTLRPSATMENNLQALRDEHPAFQEKQPVKVVVVSPITIVPLAEFEEEQGKELYHYTLWDENEPRSTHRIHYDLLPASNAVILFSIKEEVCRAIEATFGEVHYVSSVTSWVKRFATKLNVNQRRRMYLYCAEEDVDLAVYEGHHLLMLNRYELNVSADAAYYALSVAKSLGLDLQHTPISICGVPEQRDAIEQQMARYVRNVGITLLSAECNRHPIAQLSDIPFDLAMQVLYP